MAPDSSVNPSGTTNGRPVSSAIWCWVFRIEYSSQTCSSPIPSAPAKTIPGGARFFISPFSRSSIDSSRSIIWAAAAIGGQP